ncbi:MAG: type II toxin-antitoxin system PemK/MazF family toxin [Actinobacteria bacterium]|nr:type II toxin-antitoxin system PemK/MazF family toxin [Actinomycetota bacterium]
MTAGTTIRRGFIYLVDFDPVAGSGQSKRRPALVIQNDLGNSSGATTIVVSLSSRLPSRLYPFHVALPPDILGRPGVIMCEQIRTIEIDRLDKEPLAQCPLDVMHQVEQALRHSLGLSNETNSVDR